jgi:ElaA protein
MCFIVEQNAIYQELDGKDFDAIHCCYIIEKKLIGYLRLNLLDKLSAIAKFSRICVKKDYREQKIGKLLMKHAIQYAYQNDIKTVQITAQKYLTEYYKRFGFKTNSAVYLINKIEHIDMQLTLT